MKRPRSIVLNLLPYLAVIIASLPFLTVGFPDGHDSSYGLVRVAEFKASLANGQFPPYWGNNLYGGYGSPIFLFYAPLYLFVSTICSVFARSVAGGMILAVIIFSLVAVFGAKLMLREALGEHAFETEAASRVATYFFILNPYLLGDIFIRNAFSEYVALCLSPFALYSLLSIRNRPLGGGLILATSLALTITAHNLTALTVSALLAAAALFLYPPVKTPLRFWRMIVATIGLGLALAAFFWLPAIYYVSTVRSDQNVLGKFDFHNNFPALGNLFGYDEFFSAGLLTPFVMVVAAAILLCDSERIELTSRRLLQFALSGSIFSLFLQFRASNIVWETVPYLPYFQFPWRMMGPLALLTAIAAGIAFAHLCRGKPRKIVWTREGLLLSFCILNAIPHLRGARPLPQKVSGQLGVVLRPENIKNFGLSATFSNEYLPRLADANAWRLQRAAVGPVVRTVPPAELKVIEDTGTRIILETNNGTAAQLQLGRWAFTGWDCRINGEACVLGMNGIGALEISVPAGLRRIVLELHPPLLRQIMLWVSLASLIIWLVMLITILRAKNVGSHP